MATYKRIDGDYNIVSVNAVDNVVIDTHTVQVLGNLEVSGNLTYINVTELNVKDPFIVLNSSNTGSYPSNSGVLTHTAVSSFAGIRYDATAGQWEISSSTDSTGLTGTWTPIATGNVANVTVACANTQVQFNDGGSFGANANLTFDKATSRLTVQGQMVLGNIGTTPSSPSNAAAIYNNIEGSGGTGVYVKSSTVDDELVSKSAAIVFAIIF
jgi:phage baseplate assembly protein gpV